MPDAVPTELDQTQTGIEVDTKEITLADRLKGKFGPYSEETYKAQKEKWRLLLHKLDSLTGEVTSETIPLHASLKHWVGYGVMPGLNNKEKMVRAIHEDPETASEIQDFAQWILLEQGHESVNLYPGPKLRLFRGIRNKVTATEIIIQPWDSLTSDKDFAETCANPHLDWGWKEGSLLEIEVPVKNIFTYYRAHPAFNPRLPEQEFILNEKGVTGAKLISIDGRSPTPEEAVKIKDNMPGIEVVLEEKSP